MTIKEYSNINKEEILELYGAVGWTAYTEKPEALIRGMENSLLSLAACDGDRLLGFIRCIGDGETILYVQDILVFPEFQRRGIGSALLREALSRFPNVRQTVLCADAEEKSSAFYRSLGFLPVEKLGCCGYMLLK